MDESVNFGSRDYWVIAALLLFARGMDFFSTWVATPDLAMEANPLAKWMGWKRGIVVNLVMCFTAPHWPAPAIVIVTTSLLVAARNFRTAWWIRSLGEHRYHFWMAESLARASVGLYVLCVVGESALTALIGAAMFYFAQGNPVIVSIAMGIVAYALALTIYTILHRPSRSVGR